MLFISAILVYFRNLKGNVLDNSPTAINTVDIDEPAQKDYAILHGDDVTKMTAVLIAVGELSSTFPVRLRK